MALQRLSLSQIETAILECLHYPASTVAPWLTSATLYLRINDYVQRLPVIAAGMANSMRLKIGKLPLKGVPRFEMWKTVGKLTTASGDSKVYFPEDYDAPISFWDETANRPLEVIRNVDKYHSRIRKETPGPPKAIEILGGIPIQSSAVWVRYGQLCPATIAGVTPNITLNYWRIPRKMPGSSASTEFPDVDPKYEMLVIYGTASDLGTIYGRDPEKWKALADALLMDLALTAVVE